MTRTVGGMPGVQNELLDPILAQAARAPDAPALRGAGCAWSYAQLQDRLERLSAALDSLGLGPGDVCAITAQRNAETIALLLAIVACGAAYLPLDPEQPDARLSAMLEDARPQLAIVDRELRKRLPAGIAWSDAGMLREAAGRMPVQPAGALAYVLFTSGSTGRPKGVAMQTAAVAGLIDWQRAHPRLGAPARTLQFAPLTFDVSFQEIFSTLATGGALVLPSEIERRDPWRLLDLLERERAERLFLPSVALQALAEAAATEPHAPARSLRDVVTAGERLRVTPAIRAFFAARPGCVLHNHYGPTETHVVTAHELAGDPARWPDLPPIGHPLPHVSIRLDANEDPPELLLGGACLAAGYIGQAQLTAERFVTIRGRRWYRTGDRVRLLPNGGLDYRGRLDEQIKVDGRRVEPAEIEALLCRHAQVAEAAVVAQRLGEHSLRLVAHIVARADANAGTLRVELGKYCAAGLPEYMVPAAFEFHALLPATASGKIDRRALAAEGASGELQWDAAAPLEDQLAGLWRQLLGVGAVPRIANVFELGARSLTVVEALTELRRHGLALSVADIYENPTVAAQAALLRAPPIAAAASAGERARHTREAFARFAPHAAA